MWAVFMLAGLIFLVFAIGDSVELGLDAHQTPWTYLSITCMVFGCLTP